jgi:hypothetical protein
VSGDGSLWERIRADAAGDYDLARRCAAQALLSDHCRTKGEPDCSITRLSHDELIPWLRRADRVLAL